MANNNVPKESKMDIGDFFGNTPNLQNPNLDLPKYE